MSSLASVESPPPTTPTSPSSNTLSRISARTMFEITIVAALIITIFFICYILCRRKKRQSAVQSYGDPPQKQHHNPCDHIIHMPPLEPSPPRQSHSPARSTPPLQPFMSSSSSSGSDHSSLGIIFTYEELVLATDGFSKHNLLGEGGFGYVYKGVFPNGKEVAVKKLKDGSRQGEREFQAEVNIISRVHHKHLVSLVGYCISGSQRMLVYEFVSNNTMEFHLHGKKRPVLEFATRMRIALGSAKGLAYLHEESPTKIIHRDIKAANILLDFSFDAKVADFGLAKITSDDDTHVSTRVMGTHGYVAPEYASSGKLTQKSDVFSYGVMLLELITGSKPVYSADALLVHWARPLLTRALEDGNFDSIVDPRLQPGNYNHNEMARMVSSAAMCIRRSAHRRPTMSMVVQTLEDCASWSDLDDGIKPGSSSVYNGSSDYDSTQYSEEMSPSGSSSLGPYTW